MFCFADSEDSFCVQSIGWKWELKDTKFQVYWLKKKKVM